MKFIAQQILSNLNYPAASAFYVHYKRRGVVVKLPAYTDDQLSQVVFMPMTARIQTKANGMEVKALPNYNSLTTQANDPLVEKEAIASKSEYPWLSLRWPRHSAQLLNGKTTYAMYADAVPAWALESGKTTYDSSHTIKCLYKINDLPENQPSSVGEFMLVEKPDHIERCASEFLKRPWISFRSKSVDTSSIPVGSKLVEVDF